MKRPQGFVPPEPPERPKPAPPTVPPTRRGGASNDTRVDSRNDTHVDTSTEPIPIAGAPLVTPEVVAPNVFEAERRADKGVRKAERQRRRYERAEVRRFTQASRKRRMLWLGGLGGVAALALLITVAAFSPLMALRTIQVEGAKRVPAEQIVAALDGQLGTPLPLIDFTRIRAELAPFTLLQSYSTETRPPSTLVVRVVERTPLGSLATDAGYTLVDAAGVVIVESPERQPDYPVIEANGANPKRSFTAITQVIRALPPEIRAQLEAVSAESPDGVTLLLVGGQTVVWGSAEDSAIKAVVLARLMAAVDPRSVKEYDVSSPNAPVYR